MAQNDVDVDADIGDFVMFMLTSIFMVAFIFMLMPMFIFMFMSMYVFIFMFIFIFIDDASDTHHHHRTLLHGEIKITEREKSDWWYCGVSPCTFGINIHAYYWVHWENFMFYFSKYCTSSVATSWSESPISFKYCFPPALRCS